MLAQSFPKLGLVDEIRVTIALSHWVTASTYSAIPVRSRSGT
jgi:hypothetical protein